MREQCREVKLSESKRIVDKSRDTDCPPAIIRLIEDESSRVSSDQSVGAGV